MLQLYTLPRAIRFAVIFLLFSSTAMAQQSPSGQGVGVVTAIQGEAAVSRTSLPGPAELRFKDDVFFRDAISTRERSTVRLLLGGKGTLTIREQSQVTLDESITPDGARRSVLGLLVGKVGAAIARGLMRPGDSVEIRTPNAIASVRGTVFIAEYIPPQGSAAASQPILLASAAPGPLLAQAAGTGGTSNFFVLSGQVTVTPLGQPPVTLGPLQTVSVTATPGGVQAGAVQNMTPAQATQASQGLDAGKPHTGEPEGSKTAQAQVELAAALANTILQATTGQPTTPTAPVEPPASSTSANNTVTPIAPQVPPSAITGENILPAGPLLSLDNVHVGLAAGTSLITHNSGAPNTILPLGMTGGGTATVTSPLVQATGDPITHVGSYVTLTNGASIVGSSSDTTTPVMYVGGTTLTNSGGSLFDLSGGSVFATFGPVLALDDTATVTLGGLLNIAGGSAVALGPADALMIPTGNSLTTTAPLFNLSGGGLLSTYQGGSLVSVDPATLTLNAPILSATGSTVVLGGPVLRAVDSTVTSSQPLVLLQSGSSLLSTTGTVLDLKNSSVDLGAQPVIQLLGGSSFMTMAGPVIRINGGSLAADVLGSTDGNENSWGLTGTLLDLTNATVKLRTLGTDPQKSTDSSIFSLNPGEPWIRMANSDLTLTGVGEALLDPGSRTESTVGGLGLIATSTLGNTISLAGPLLDLDWVSLTEPNPYIQLTNMTVSETGSNSFIEAVEGTPVSLAGPLITGSNSKFINAGSFLKIRDGSTLTSTTTQPLMQFSGSTVSMNGNLFNIGSGPGQPGSTANLAGPLLNATNSTFDSGPVSSFVTINDGATFTSTTTDPLLTVSGGSITTKSHVFRVGLGNAYQGAATVPNGSKDPVNATLAGPVLKATDATITTPFGLVAIRDRGTFKSTTTAPLIQLGGSVGTTLNLVGQDLDPASPTYGQQANGRMFDIQPSLTATPFATSAELFGPVLSATNTTINTSDRILDAFALGAASATLTSHTTDPLVQLTGGHVTMSGTFAPSGTTTDTSGSFLRMSSPSSSAQSIITLAGPLLSATGTTFYGQNHFLRINQYGKLTSTTPNPLVQFSGVALRTDGIETVAPTSGSPTISSFGDFARVQGTGATLGLAGPLLRDVNGTYNLAGSVLQVRDGGRLTNSAAITLLNFSGSTVNMNGSVFQVRSGAGQPGSTATLAGPVLAASNSAFNSGPNANFFNVHDGAAFTSTTASPMLMVTGGSVMADGHLVRVGLTNMYNAGGSQVPTGSQAPVSMTLAGPLLLGTDTSISAKSDSVLAVRDRATFKSTTTAPLIELSGLSPCSVTCSSTLSLGGPDPDPASPTYGQVGGGSILKVAPVLASPYAASAELSGSLLSAMSTKVSTLGGSILQVAGRTGASATLTSHTTDPLVQLASSSLTMSGTSTSSSTGGTTVNTTGNFLGMSSPDSSALATLALAGPLLQASYTTISAHDHFMNIGSNTRINGAGTTAAIQLTNTPLTVQQSVTFTPTGGGTPSVSTNGILLNVYGNNAIVALAGPLLTATNSPLSLAGSLMHVANGGRLTSTTTDPLFSLSGGTHSPGNATGIPSVFDLHGVNTDPSLGVGSDLVLQTGGPILQTSGATMNLSDAAHAISLDTALVSAAGPIISLINASTMNTSTSGAGLMNVYQSNVTSMQVVKLDNSILTVQNGPLLSLTGGSQMTVNGDFANLINGSRLTVLNGPLISVDGVNAKGTASNLHITGGLINYGGNGGNQVIINNTVTPTATLSGIPVSQTGAGSSVNIGPNPIKNPGLGTLNVTCPGDCSGSVIRATNGGRVTIIAP